MYVNIYNLHINIHMAIYICIYMYVYKHYMYDEISSDTLTENKPWKKVPKNQTSLQTSNFVFEKPKINLNG